MSTSWQEEGLEYVPCDLCGSLELRPLYTRPDGMIVVECANCALAFLNPRPKPQVIERLYDDAYFQKSSPNSDCGYSNYLSDDGRRILLEQARFRLDALKRIWSPAAKRCLEIGCATGEFCHVLAQCGAVTTGIDLSSFVIQTARNRYPSLDFRVGDVETVSGSRKFDVVFGFELIEHVMSPKRFLSSANGLIAEGGLLVLTTPNLICGRKRGFDKWGGFHASFEHLYFFEPQALSRYAQSTGFEVLHWLTGGGDGVVHSPDEKQRHTPQKTLMKTLKSLGLLTPARRLRRMFQNYVGIYRNHGEEHNLLIILRKTVQSAHSY